MIKAIIYNLLMTVASCDEGDMLPLTEGKFFYVDYR